MKARYEENVQIELIDINNVEGREDWLQQVAEVLQIFPPEDGPLTTNMFFTAISSTADTLQYEKISTKDIERKAKIDEARTDTANKRAEEREKLLAAYEQVCTVKDQFNLLLHL